MLASTVRTLELGVLAVSARGVRVRGRVEIAFHPIAGVFDCGVLVGAAHTTALGLLANASCVVKATTVVTNADTRGVLKAARRAELPKDRDRVLDGMARIGLRVECENE